MPQVLEPPTNPDGWAWRVRSDRVGHQTFSNNRFGDYVTVHDWLAEDLDRIDKVDVTIVWWD